MGFLVLLDEEADPHVDVFLGGRQEEMTEYCLEK